MPVELVEQCFGEGAMTARDGGSFGFSNGGLATLGLETTSSVSRKWAPHSELSLPAFSRR
jgi:hypothetical protein